MPVPIERPMRPESHRATAVVDRKPSERFLLSDTSTYDRQYSSIYYHRLRQLRLAVQATARVAFGEASPDLFFAETIVEATAFSRQHSNTNANRTPLSTDGDAESPVQQSRSFTVITGVVFRQMQSKPSILAQYEHPSPHTLVPHPPPRSTTTYVSTNDQVFLEDDHARCKLDLQHLDPSKASMFITGFIVAVRGRENHQCGTYSVYDVTFANPAPQRPLRAPPPPSQSPHFVCLVSGLGISSVAVLPELLLETLRGTFSDASVLAAKQVVHTIIAGNLLAASSPSASSDPSRSRKAEMSPDSPAQYLDRYLLALAASMPVTVMPGHVDSTNALLPQQPLHRCLLPNASRCSNLSRDPNPHAMTIDGVHFVGTSGQNIFDLALYQEHVGPSQDEFPSAEQTLDLLESLVRGRHLAPTCPDTLGCFPFDESDPFVLEETPHVLFAGNQREFGSRKMCLTSNDRDIEMTHGDKKASSAESEKFVRLISIPSYALTGQAVFLDLTSLECHVQTFAVSVEDA